MNLKQQVTLSALLVGVILFLAGALPRNAKFFVTGVLAALAAGSFILENDLAKTAGPPKRAGAKGEVWNTVH